jgi:hypothetical protein
MPFDSETRGGKHTRKSNRPRDPKPFKTTLTPTGEAPTSKKTIPVAQTPGATVWATFYNIFSSYQGKPGGGYSHVIENFHSIDELASQLEGLGLRNKVAHLALVGHNEAAFSNQKEMGTVTFDPPLPGTSSVPDPLGRLGRDHPPPRPTSPNAFAKLAPYLLGDGMLSFFMCWSGGGQPGSELLKNVSSILPGRTIVGFCVSLEIGSGGANDPGNVCGVDEGQCSPAMKPLTPWGLPAKRAWMGKIIHEPALSRKGPPFHCANPHCPGHSDQRHDCPDGWWLLE